VATCAGAGLLSTGAHRFAGTGTDRHHQPLVTGGIYRHSRTPQYAGYILTRRVTRRVGELYITYQQQTPHRWWENR
jgi:hypothetical protein